MNLLTKYKKSGAIILSGDVHYAKIHSSGCRSLTGGYFLYEFVSSGLTHHANYFQHLIEQETEWVTSDFYSSKKGKENNF